jgi:hypothetical protein
MIRSPNNRGRTRRNVSQGGGLSLSFRAGDEELIRTAVNSEARNANIPFSAVPSAKRQTSSLAVHGSIGWRCPWNSPASNQPTETMTIKALVLSDRPDEYNGKRGLVKQQVITVIDQEPGNNRLTQPLEYSLSDEEKLKYAGKLQDKTIKLGIREIVPFGGRLRVRGQIVEVDGLK